MIALKNLLNIICTEAFEYDGIHEVPDHKYGAPREPPALRYDLELVEEPDGGLHWVE